MFVEDVDIENVLLSSRILVNTSIVSCLMIIKLSHCMQSFLKQART